ncbi:MAG TPA: DinB family protein [Thermoplasmata archaeon]|nr:DinB family protein [Thermoplasmata archaeon]
MDPRDLVRWNHAVRLRFARFFETVPWEVLSEDRGASNGSISSIFMHGTNMEDWWLNYVLRKREWDGPKFDGFKDARSMRERVEGVNTMTERFLAKLKPSDLERPADLSSLGADAPKALRLADLLVETVTEDTHHRGEILAMLWMRDIEPPDVSFLEYAAGRGGARKPAERRKRR